MIWSVNRQHLPRLPVFSNRVWNGLERGEVLTKWWLHSAHAIPDKRLQRMRQFGVWSFLDTVYDIDSPLLSDSEDYTDDSDDDTADSDDSDFPIYFYVLHLGEAVE